MKLLMLISTAPRPPLCGALLRWWAMIRLLGERHDLTLVTFGDEQYPDWGPLLHYCRSIHTASWIGNTLPNSEELPYLVKARRLSTMRETLRAIPTGQYDAAIIEQIGLAQFHEEIDAPAIFGEHNIESSLLKQSVGIAARPPSTNTFENAEQEALLMERYENLMWPQFNLRTAVNPHERDEMQRRSTRGQTILVENGTDPDLWLEQARADTECVVFFGLLDYLPNTDGILYFWTDIWPHLVRRRPSVRFVIAGSRATPELWELSRESRVTLIENPEDIRDVAALASLSIVPLRMGGGTRLKILDSMALGLPVVSTSLGCDGLAVEDGEHLLIRDDPEAFAEAIDELLRDRRLWQRLRLNGKTAVRERYVWDQTLRPLEPALLSIAR